MSELIAHLKSRPKNRYGTNNPANVVATAYLRSISGFVAEPVNYKGAADALVDVENGTLDFMIFDGAFVIAPIKSGKLRPLAVTSEYRVKALPDVPTMIEAGFKDYVFNPWWGVYVPTGTQQQLIDKLAGWFSAVAKSSEIAKALDPLVLVPFTITAAEMNKRLDADGPVWSENLKAAGISPQ
jgi:tripartite-type tricarboxylate transporter receptor subunit TctC